MLKVLILIPDLPKETGNLKGGVHSSLMNLLNGFKSKQIRIEVLSILKNNGKNETIYFSDNIHIKYVHEGFFPFHSLNYFFFGSQLLKNEIRDFQPDIIHFQEGNTFLFMSLFLRLKIPLLLTMHGFAYDEAKRKIKLRDKITWYYNGLVNKILMPRNIIHLSAFSNAKIYSPSIKNNIIIPNSIVEGYFKIPQKKITTNKLIYIGIIDNNKNLFYTLTILKRLIDIGCPYSIDVLGGFSNDMIKEMILNQVKHLNLLDFVNFKGWVGKKEVMESLNQVDILVVSSKHESLPMVIAESMAAGKVVVCSDVGGIPEMIHNEENGFLHNLADTDSLFKILVRLYNNHELVHNTGMKARQHASDNFHCSSVAEKTMKFYLQILNTNESI